MCHTYLNKRVTMTFLLFNSTWPEKKKDKKDDEQKKEE
jgi:hypothetical protein